MDTSLKRWPAAVAGSRKGQYPFAILIDNMTNITTDSKSVEKHFETLFSANIDHNLNGNNGYISKLRREGMHRFSELGLPGKKSEAWKYTPVRRFLKSDYAFNATISEEPTASQLNTLFIEGLDAYRMVLVNGHFAPTLSNTDGLPDGVTCSSFNEAQQTKGQLIEDHLGKYTSDEQDPFVALNNAFLLDGIVIHVPKGVVVDKPVFILHITTAGKAIAIMPRILVIAEENSQINIIERHASFAEQDVFYNPVAEMVTGMHAHVHHYQIQDAGNQQSMISTIYAYQHKESYYSTLTVTLSGNVVRNNLTILPDAEGCESHLLGLVLGKGKMHVDNHTLVDHAKPNCFSNELYKNILDNESTGVFNGKVLVRQDAQQINAYQSNKSVTLTDDARMFSKPELEIYADDVRCSHGATTGQLDAEALFYLRSRGLKEEQARAMLLQAFVGDVLETIKIEPLRAYLIDEIAQRI